MTASNYDTLLDSIYTLAKDAGKECTLPESKDILSKAVFTISFVGRIKTGKTTLINCLIGSGVLPATVLPTTAALTIIDHGTPEQINISLVSGEEETIPFSIEKLRQFIQTSQTDNNGIINSVRFSHHHNLPANVILMDTPGVDDTDEWRSLKTIVSVKQSDISVIVFTYPITKSMLDFVRNNLTANDKKKLFFCLTFIDKYENKEEIEEILEESKSIFTKELNFTPDIFYFSPIHILNHPEKEENASEFNRFKQSVVDFLSKTDSSQLLIDRAAYKMIDFLDGIIIEFSTISALKEYSPEERSAIITNWESEIASARSQLFELEARHAEKISNLKDRINESLATKKNEIKRDLKYELSKLPFESYKGFLEHKANTLIHKSMQEWEKNTVPIIEQFLSVISNESNNFVLNLTNTISAGLSKSTKINLSITNINSSGQNTVNFINPSSIRLITYIISIISSILLTLPWLTIIGILFGNVMQGKFKEAAINKIITMVNSTLDDGFNNLQLSINSHINTFYLENQQLLDDSLAKKIDSLENAIKQSEMKLKEQIETSEKMAQEHKRLTERIVVLKSKILSEL